jgi:hypothetical protein
MYITYIREGNVEPLDYPIAAKLLGLMWTYLRIRFVVVNMPSGPLVMSMAPKIWIIVTPL